jgi:hypothetical protein
MTPPSSPDMPDGIGPFSLPPPSARTQRELRVCQAIDQLGLALAAARIVLDGTAEARRKLGLEPEAGALARQWAASRVVLTSAFAQVEASGQETIDAAKAMLGLD